MCGINFDRWGISFEKDFFTENLSVKMFVAGSITEGFLGYLGGHCIKLFSSSVVPAAHGFVFGTFPLMAVGVYLLADKINKGSFIFNSFLALTGGYVTSVVASNLLGLSISLAGPVASFSAVAITATIVTAIAGPAMTLCGCALCTLPCLGVMANADR